MAFNDSQYDELMNVYYQHQTENRMLEEARKAEVYKVIPRIARNEMHLVKVQ